MSITSKLINIWTLGYLSRSENTIRKEQERLQKLEAQRAIKYAVRILWEDLAVALDELCKEEVFK